MLKTVDNGKFWKKPSRKNIQWEGEQMNKRTQIKEVAFQMNNAEQIYNKLFQEGQNHYLLADETGLGKTVTTANVIIKLYNERTNQQKSPIRICYICANMALAGENIKKLHDTIEDKIKFEKETGNKISIQKKTFERLPLAFREINNNDKGVSLSIQAITPATSLKVQSKGTLEERSYAYSLIVGPEGKEDSFLKKVCQGNVSDEEKVNKEIKKAKQKLYNSKGEPNEYCKEFCKEFREIFKQERSMLVESIVEDLLKIVVYNKENSIKSLYILEKITEAGVYTGNTQNTIKSKIRKIENEIKEKKFPLDETKLKEIKNVADQFVNEKKQIIELSSELDKNIWKGHYFEKYKNKIIEYIAKESQDYFLIKCLELIKTKNDRELDKFEREFIDDCIDCCNRRVKSYDEKKQTKYSHYNDDLLSEIADNIEEILLVKGCYKIFNIARMSMAVASLHQLKVDLFIADEIQNYSEIFVRGCFGNNSIGISNPNNDNKTETELVIQEVLFKEDCKVLMLSATPFRYRTKLIELENRNKDVNCDSELSPGKTGKFSDQEYYIKEKTDIYEEFKKIITYLKPDFDFEMWNNLCKNKNTYVVEDNVQKVIEVVKQQSKMLQDANVSRIERYMSGVEMRYKEDDTLIGWDDIGMDELMCIPQLDIDISTIDDNKFFDLCIEEKGSIIVYDSNMYFYDQREFYYLSDDIREWVNEQFVDYGNQEMWDNAEWKLEIEKMDGIICHCIYTTDSDSSYIFSDLERKLKSNLNYS